MDIFFNELSVKIASNDKEAEQWLIELAKLGKLLKEIIESLEEDSFCFRRKEDFGLQKITLNQNIIGFLQSKFDYGDPVYIFLLGIFDSPYISEDDPQKTEYDLTFVTINNKDYDCTGIAAAYLKDSLAISLNNDNQWDICQLDISICRLNEKDQIITEQKQIKHASKKQHIIDCHLPFLARLYNWQSYKPEFDPATRKQNILPLINLCSLYFRESWDNFYSEIKQLNSQERVAKYKEIAEKISKIHRWKRVSQLEERNSGRVIYEIPSSEFIVGLDTEQGEFEIHNRQKGNNHLGSISFNGIQIKEKKETRSLIL